MRTDSSRWNINRGVVSAVRMVSVWIALALAVQIGLNPVLSTLLLNESLVVPFSSGVVTVIAAFYVYRHYPPIETGQLWMFGIVVCLVSLGLGMLTGSFPVRGIGSLYHTVIALLTWIAALVIGFGLVYADR